MCHFLLYPPRKFHNITIPRNWISYRPNEIVPLVFFISVLVFSELPAGLRIVKSANAIRTVYNTHCRFASHRFSMPIKLIIYSKQQFRQNLQLKFSNKTTKQNKIRSKITTWMRLTFGTQFPNFFHAKSRKSEPVVTTESDSRNWKQMTLLFSSLFSILIETFLPCVQIICYSNWPTSYLSITFSLVAVVPESRNISMRFLIVLHSREAEEQVQRNTVESH